jgi:hypothetical protein
VHRPVRYSGNPTVGILAVEIVGAENLDRSRLSDTVIPVLRRRNMTSVTSEKDKNGVVRLNRRVVDQVFHERILDVFFGCLTVR